MVMDALEFYKPDKVSEEWETTRETLDNLLNRREQFRLELDDIEQQQQQDLIEQRAKLIEKVDSIDEQADVLDGMLQEVY